MMTYRQTILLSAAWASLDGALRKGSIRDVEAAAQVAAEILTLVAELEKTERAMVAPVPTALDENCS